MVNSNEEADKKLIDEVIKEIEYFKFVEDPITPHTQLLESVMNSNYYGYLRKLFIYVLSKIQTSLTDNNLENIKNIAKIEEYTKLAKEWIKYKPVNNVLKLSLTNFNKFEPMSIAKKITPKLNALANQNIIPLNTKLFAMISILISSEKFRASHFTLKKNIEESDLTM